MLKARNLNIKIGDIDMDYISFGKGNRILIMLPGLGDGLRTVKGTALSLALMYRIFAKDFRVFVFSRRNQLPVGYTIAAMAGDQAAVLRQLSIKKAAVMGVSQGGMIAQELAIGYPELVEKLVLADTVGGQNDTLQTTVNGWLTLARAGDFHGLFIDTAEKSYSQKYLKKVRRFYPILAKFSKPKSMERFMIQATACLHHAAEDRLAEISCPTLVIGGSQDKIVGQNASGELADRIVGSKLLLYPELGHAAYEEAPDFNTQVLAFLNE